MDIGKFNKAGEWLELEAENKEIGILKFKVLPASGNDVFNLDKVGDSLVPFIVDWNIEKDGKKLECNDANKLEWMKYLAIIPVKRPEPVEGEKPEPKFVGTSIITFTQNLENYLKK